MVASPGKFSGFALFITLPIKIPFLAVEIVRAYRGVYRFSATNFRKPATTESVGEQRRVFAVIAPTPVNAQMAL